MWVLTQDGTLVNLDHASTIYVRYPIGNQVAVTINLGTGVGDEWNPVDICSFPHDRNKLSDERDEEGERIFLPNPSKDAAIAQAKKVIAVLANELSAMVGKKEEGILGSVGD